MPKTTLSSTGPDALTELRAVNARFIHNFVTNDVASHDAMLHPQFLYIGSDGGYVSRAEYLAAWAHGFDPKVIVYWDVRDERITVFGDLALVRATNKCIALKRGTEDVSVTVYTDVYVRAGKRWLCVQAQITRVLPECEPPDSTIISVYRRGVRQ